MILQTTDRLDVLGVPQGWAFGVSTVEPLVWLPVPPQSGLVDLGDNDLSGVYSGLMPFAAELMIAMPVGLDEYQQVELATERAVLLGPFQDYRYGGRYMVALVLMVP